MDLPPNKKADDREESSPAEASGDQFQPTCTVVICTRNRPDQLSRALEALAGLNYPGFEVLVVDNSSGDDETRQVADRWKARYVLEPVPGLSRARNRGAHCCDTEIVAFIDDDSFPDREWLTGLAIAFKDPRVMAATGPIVGFDADNPQLSQHVSVNTRTSIIDRETACWFERANFGGVGDGGNMAFRRSAFEIWPGFDERLGRGAIIDGGEEHNAFFSLIQRGYRIVRVNHALVYHPLPADERGLRTRSFKSIAAAAAYTTVLLVEHPTYRWAAMKYALEALWGSPRPWRGQAAKGRRVVSRPRSLLALLSGPFLYIRSMKNQKAIGMRQQAGSGTLRVKPAPVLSASVSHRH